MNSKQDSPPGLRQQALTVAFKKITQNIPNIQNIKLVIKARQKYFKDTEELTLRIKRLKRRGN